MSIATNRKDNYRELERRITAVKRLDSSRYKSIRTLHFEGISDYYLVKEFCSESKNQTLPKRSKHFAHSKNKTKAIENHIDAISLGFKISTIVDMDHDCEDRELSTHSNIRSTNPSCTLLTLLLQGNDKLEEAIERMPLSEKPSTNQIKIILKHATERTLERMSSGLFRTGKKLDISGHTLKQEFMKKVPHPMNDHSLCESIYLHKSGTYIEEEKGWRWASLGKNNKAKKAINKSLNDSAKKLGSKTLEELVISMIEETKTTAYFEDE